MAKELVHFTNFAKLKDTSVAFNDITVIAGKPGTGKSYVMKMMYALNVSPLESLSQSIEKFNTITSQRLEVKKDGTLVFKDVSRDIEEGLEKLEDQAKSITVEKTLKNILNSIFLSMEQISNSFTVETKYQTIQYDENLNIKSKKQEETEEESNFDFG